MRGSLARLLAPLLLCGQMAVGQVPEVGDEAVDFTLESLDGGAVTLSDFRGKVVFINFFGYS